MVNCSFCGTNIERGTGLTYVKKDGKILHFCSRKCEKNMIQLGRKPRNVTWTAEHRAAKAQMMAAADKPKKKKPKTVKAPAKTPVAKKAVKKAATVKK